jgi:hypothetical protein
MSFGRNDLGQAVGHGFNSFIHERHRKTPPAKTDAKDGRWSWQIVMWKSRTSAGRRFFFA